MLDRQPEGNAMTNERVPSKRKEAVLGFIIGVAFLIVDCVVAFWFVTSFKPDEMKDGLGPIFRFIIGICAPMAMIFAAFCGVAIIARSLFQLISGRGDVLAKIKTAFTDHGKTE